MQTAFVWGAQRCATQTKIKLLRQKRQNQQAPPVGLEPTTSRLEGGRSNPTELWGQRIETYHRKIYRYMIAHLGQRERTRNRSNHARFALPIAVKNNCSLLLLTRPPGPYLTQKPERGGAAKSGRAAPDQSTAPWALQKITCAEPRSPACIPITHPYVELLPSERRGRASRRRPRRCARVPASPSAPSRERDNHRDGQERRAGQDCALSPPFLIAIGVSDAGVLFRNPRPLRPPACPASRQ